MEARLIIAYCLIALMAAAAAALIVQWRRRVHKERRIMRGDYNR